MFGIQSKSSQYPACLSMFWRSLCQGYTIYRSNFPAVTGVYALHTCALVCTRICCL